MAIVCYADGCVYTWRGCLHFWLKAMVDCNVELSRSLSIPLIAGFNYIKFNWIELNSWYTVDENETK